ncbi:acetyltransferase-like isoleucine patch superfamily enzyme [Oxalobacteraceae bacterium GrIS 2.11]
MAMLSRAAIENMGFKQVGNNVSISDKASFYNCPNIEIGDNSRIDDFCILSAGTGGISIGRHVHVASYSSLIGSGNITLDDFSGLSSRVTIYSSTDDYSGTHLTNPTVPKKFTHVLTADVLICRHVIIGCGAVVLPGIRLEQGVAIGALSLVNRDCKEFGIYAGTPARFLKARSRKLLELEELLKNENQVQ